MSSEAKELTKTQRQILDAAISCVTQWGIERVTLNDIAYEARVARSTVYSYYKTRDDVIRAALMSSAKGFGEKLFEHICQFATAEERTLEAVLYSLQKFPDEPALSLLSDTALTEMVREHSLTAGGGMDMGSALFQVILQDDSYTQEELEEISEFSIRFMLSLLTMHSPRERSEEELRGFIARRLLPSIGLSVPLQYQRLRSAV
jgi:AcrR family transcriptional regulator